MLLYAIIGSLDPLFWPLGPLGCGLRPPCFVPAALSCALPRPRVCYGGLDHKYENRALRAHQRAHSSAYSTAHERPREGTRRHATPRPLGLGCLGGTPAQGWAAGIHASGPPLDHRERWPKATCRRHCTRGCMARHAHRLRMLHAYCCKLYAAHAVLVLLHKYTMLYALCYAIA